MYVQIHDDINREHSCTCITRHKPTDQFGSSTMICRPSEIIENIRASPGAIRKLRSETVFPGTIGKLVSKFTLVLKRAFPRVPRGHQRYSNEMSGPAAIREFGIQMLFPEAIRELGSERSGPRDYQRTWK